MRTKKYVNEIAEVIVLKAKAESYFASLYANLCVFICGVEDLSALSTSGLSEGEMQSEMQSPPSSARCWNIANNKWMLFPRKKMM